MAVLLRVVPLAAALALGGCSKKASDEETTAEAPPAPQASTPAPEPAATPAPPQNTSKFGQPPPADTVATVFGRGTYSPIDGKPMNYTFDVNFGKEGNVSGAAEFSMFDGSEKFDVSATINCGHYDLETKRVWIGGEIDANKSTLAAYQTDRFGTGQPIWFRFLESDTHPKPAAKMSPPEFAGDGHADAAEFCKEKGWLAGNGGLFDITDESAVIVFALPEGG